MCVSPVFWGVVLLAIGFFGILPNDLTRYAWPAVAIAAGAWLLLGPLGWYQERPSSPYDEPADRL